jgi:hypothetical protein
MALVERKPATVLLSRYPVQPQYKHLFLQVFEMGASIIHEENRYFRY